MKKTLLALAVLAPSVFSLAPAAHAAVCVTTNPPAVNPACADDDSAGDGPSAVGFTCGFTSSDDPSGAVGQPGQQIGEVDGGPVLVAELPVIDTTNVSASWEIEDNPASGTITCSIQVGGTGVYTDADAASASASGTVVVYLPPTEITYFAAPTDNVWSCTTWTLSDADGDDTQTLYLDDTSGEFVTDPAAAHCALAISQEVTPPPTA